MKKLFFGLLLSSNLFFSQDLKVMTYNIRLSLESDKENSWDNRKNDALALMSYYHPDYFGVQEAVPQQMTDIKTSLKDYDYVGVGRDDGKNQGEYSAIFYDKTKLEVTKSGTFWLSETPEKPSKGWDAAYNRVCTYAFFKIKKTGKQFLAMNLHFDHVGDVARVNSAKLILEKVKELNPKNLPLTLTGDFNLTDDSEPIKIISKSLDNAFYHSKKPHYGPIGTFTAFDVNTVPKERIDYIFVKGFDVLSNRTINDRRENLLYPSDHFPILAEIKFKK
ncbi:endonuclease/exonuclease/phosphatase family protein [Epilithonimonas arachidiradicis]|uniref:Endonuclease n=1 Tax=Epilithonimonas arachidiradicis TaxID=1617282 RepID=A0A420DAZ5_9FLAO|nr:endonuclease/exonuclease/phosphatase family protein [Epilithonimonas arachidiradicis]RKE88736.1 endonuclease/exonuclease/phosphatase family metal-dependent hydrolase [Epilithonimonas arachidiradicis]GGG55452.1 endonuclease [Epilithonimonas arachidiradicis]